MPVSEAEDYTLQCYVDYTYLINAPQAFGHSIGPQSKAWHEDREVHLKSQPCVLPSPVNQLTMLAHSLPIRPGELGAKFTNTFVQLLNLRLSQYCPWWLGL